MIKLLIIDNIVLNSVIESNVQIGPNIIKV